MAKKKELQAIAYSNIHRALGKIEGVAFGLDQQAAGALFDAVELLEDSVKELVKNEQ